MKAIITITFLAIFLTASLVMADQGRNFTNDNDEKCQKKSEMKQAQTCLDRLNTLLDRWHEANLEGHEKKIHQYEQAIINELVKDINASFHAAEKADRKVSNVLAGEEDQSCQRVLLAGKQAVLYKLKKSDSFSLKYRALSKYQDLLCQQLGRHRLELAEGDNQSRPESK
ncbi:MAG: hypothetical protein JSU74_07610 [Candidatus Zixiibacteriota bacterium]|nr:MAG: hypothetical protein JSU74_07610 [candidate division Zixibacteria bacterium]